MTQNTVTNKNNCWIIASQDMAQTISAQWFDDKYWLNQGRLLGASSGRGSAWMVKSETTKMMLRHYYRGGIPAKFNRDKYFWMGLNNSRSFSEFRLLQKMYHLKLPVPQPIAAQTCKKGLFYQANILIKYIPHESTFASLLNENSDIIIWKNTGKTIAQFHKHGINHADLNANNILVNKNEIYLIDFDHSKQQSKNDYWQQANLKRLKRSIDKLTDEQHITSNASKWKKLLTSYQQELKKTQ